MTISNELGWFWKEPLVSTQRFDQYALIVFWRWCYRKPFYRFLEAKKLSKIWNLRWSEYNQVAPWVSVGFRKEPMVDNSMFQSVCSKRIREPSSFLEPTQLKRDLQTVLQQISPKRQESDEQWLLFVFYLSLFSLLLLSVLHQTRIFRDCEEDNPGVEVVGNMPPETMRDFPT